MYVYISKGLEIAQQQELLIKLLHICMSDSLQPLKNTFQDILMTREFFNFVQKIIMNKNIII